MISGTMPRWQQNIHMFGFGLMCLLLGGFGLRSIRFLLPVRGVWPSKGLFVSSLVFMAVASFGIGMQLWFRRRRVKNSITIGAVGLSARERDERCRQQNFVFALRPLLAPPADRRHTGGSPNPLRSMRGSR